MTNEHSRAVAHFCPFCGTPLGGGALFCGHCGKRIGVAPSMQEECARY
ncbi:MAG: hypothetical protein IJW71_00695 [Clostridia bacterium]|nr:hypothetical protein [Clostridia bacterium]